MKFLDKYLNCTQNDLADILNNIEILTKNKKMVLYGAGPRGKMASKILSEYHIKIDCFCDDDALNGKYLNGSEIVSFDKIKNCKKEDFCFLITCYNYEKISNKLISNGFNDIYYCPELLVKTVNITELKKYEDKIEQLLNILSDEKSKQVVENIIEHIVTRNIEQLSSTKDDIVYFDADIINFNEKEVFIDAGAYTGDTIMAFNEIVKGKFEKIYAFEPDSQNFNALKSNTKKSGNNIILNNLGLHNMNGRLKFTSSDIGSRITDTGEITIEVVKLDDFIKNDIPTFIKMDIEGSELQALYGAEQLIKKHAPKMAICIYHNLEDLWEIPLYLKFLVPHYNIFIRHYNEDNQNETICYAFRNHHN